MVEPVTCTCHLPQFHYNVEFGCCVISLCAYVGDLETFRGKWRGDPPVGIDIVPDPLSPRVTVPNLVVLGQMVLVYVRRSARKNGPLMSRPSVIYPDPQGVIIPPVFMRHPNHLKFKGGFQGVFTGVFM